MRFKTEQPLVLGVMGGIASGKSTIAQLLAEEGLRHIDADRIAREVAEEPQILAALRLAFPAELFQADGQLDREAMARLVFSDAAARKRLEEILHPAIRQRILAELEAARGAGDSVVLDAPLLLEGGLIEHCDACLFVKTSEAARRERAAARGWSAEELRRREENQAPLPMKIARSAYTIDNSGPLPRTRERLIELLAQLKSNPPEELRS
ncbi:MAG: dephospho-CoA kinase [Planctomycetota bacterium]